VKRLVAGLAVLVLAGFLAACGGQSATTIRPAVTASWGPEVDLSRGTVYSATLTLSVSPAGVIAFKSVRAGRVRTFSAYRFTGFEGPGAAIVSVGRGAVDASWSLPGSGTWLKRSRALLPRGSKAFGTGWSGSTIEEGQFDGERILWAQERYVGAAPSAGEMPMELEALVEASRRHPSRTSYCLTLQLTAP
jgi:hypothetical protein